MTFEQKLAYDIGAKKAHEEYRVKEAQMALLKGGFNTGKWLLGMGSGSAAKNMLGGGLGYGGLGAYNAEDGWENRLKGFGGGFASGLVFSGASAAASRGLRGLNKSYASGAKALSSETQTLARTLDQQKKNIHKMTRANTRKGQDALSDQTKNKLKDMEAAYKDNQGAYKQLLKNQNVGIGTRINESFKRNMGTTLGFTGGMAGGMYLSGQIAKPFEESQRKMLYAQNNVFNQVGNYRS